jgi:signal transduction histidine kinase
VPQPGLGYLVFPFAIWAALRLGLRGAAAAVLLTASIAIGLTAGGEPRDLVLLQLFLAAFALSTLLLAASWTERRQAQARIAALHATARALADADAVPSAPGIFAAISSSLVWECGSLWTVDAEREALVCLDVWRRGGGEDGFTRATRAIRFPRGVGLPGRVWADGAAAWVRDVTVDLNFPRAAAAAATGLRAGFAVPLTLDGRVVGVLEFFSKARARPDAVLLETMTFVGTQVGRVLERRQAREAVRRSERDLQVANLELRRSNLELERFASIASHDLQEPLRTITTFTQLFELRHGSGLDPEAREVLGFVVEGAARMSALISGLLEYSRVGQGVRPQPLLGADIAQEALANLAGTIAEKGARVRVADLPEVLADRRELVQVFQNLIGNAVKFSGARVPEVDITGWREGDAVHFRVSDNGIGIPPGLLDRAFVLFQRLHASQGYPGTGLGLAICKKIVEGHGGRIWAESVVGEGSSVHFTLPPPDRSGTASI